MTLMEAITRIDELKYNTYSREEKIRWLSKLDGMVKHQIMDTHEQSDAVPFTGYDGETPGDTVLLVPEPYDELYLWWLAAQIDYYNGEFDRYNNSVALFNTGFDVYGALHHRKHMPKSGRTAFY